MSQQSQAPCSCMRSSQSRSIGQTPTTLLTPTFSSITFARKSRQFPSHSLLDYRVSKNSLGIGHFRVQQSGVSMTISSETFFFLYSTHESWSYDPISPFRVKPNLDKKPGNLPAGKQVGLMGIQVTLSSLLRSNLAFPRESILHGKRGKSPVRKNKSDYL